MKAVAAALADGIITPGEGAIARILDSFVPVIEADDFARRFTVIARTATTAEAGRLLLIRLVGYST
jgi:hypothetical protein